MIWSSAAVGQGAGVAVDLRQGPMQQLPAGAVVEGLEDQEQGAGAPRLGQRGTQVEELVSPDGDHDQGPSLARGAQAVEGVEDQRVGEVGVVDDDREGRRLGGGFDDAAGRGGELLGQAPTVRAPVGDAGVGQVGQAQQLLDAVGQVAPIGVELAPTGRSIPAEHRGPLLGRRAGPRRPRGPARTTPARGVSGPSAP